MRKVFILLLAALLIMAAGCDLFGESGEDNGALSGEEDDLDGEVIDEDCDETGDETVDENGEDEPPPPVDICTLTLVYTKGGNLKLAEGDNPPVSLTAGGNDYSPLFSPDGQHILFRRNVTPGSSGLERFELWLVDREGSARPLVTHEDLPGVMGTPMGSDTPVLLDRLPWQTVWLSDSRRIAFNTRIEYGFGLPLSHDLWIVNIDTGVLANVLPDDEGGTFVFSPDETRLLIANAETVSLMNADGTNRKYAMKFPLVNTASEYAFVPYPVWTPDGGSGMVATSSPEPFGPSPDNSLWKINLAGKAAQMGTLPGMNLIMEDRLWSPDRVRLAYVNDAGHLCLANSDGSGSTVYANDVDYFWGWAPGGQHFIFSKNYGENVLLGSPGSPAEPFVDFDEVGRVLKAKWADEAGYGFIVLGGALWKGELDGDNSLIDTTVSCFDVYRD